MLTLNFSHHQPASDFVLIFWNMVPNSLGLFSYPELSSLESPLKLSLSTIENKTASLLFLFFLLSWINLIKSPEGHKCRCLFQTVAVFIMALCPGWCNSGTNVGLKKGGGGNDYILNRDYPALQSYCPAIFSIAEATHLSQMINASSESRYVWERLRRDASESCWAVVLEDSCPKLLCTMSIARKSYLKLKLVTVQLKCYFKNFFRGLI